MSLKILLIAGHGEGDNGAVGLGFTESERVRALVKELHKYLIKKNIDTVIFPMNQNCYRRIRAGEKVNFAEYGYVCEIHLNASLFPQTRGTMCYISQSETGHSVEDKILNCLCSLGYQKSWDGVVVSQRQFPSGLLVQETCRKAGISHTLLETCFVTNQEDMYIFNSRLDQVAKAVGDGIIDGFGLQNATQMIKVTDESLNVRRGPGVEYDIMGVISDYGVYTIVERCFSKDGGIWGKLLSGMGWINLAYTKNI